VGRISYSLYLWHWPVLVFGRVHLERSVTGATLGALVLAMVLLAVASYYLVERPWRRTNGLLGSRGTFALAGAVVAAAVAFGAIVIHNGGFANRYPGTFELAPTNYRAPHCMLGAHQKQSGWAGAECLVNDVRSPVVMFWGDSYSAHYIPAILKRRADLRFNILQYNLGACAPVLGYDMAGRSDCRIFNDAAQSIIERFGVRTVVLAANWSGYKGRGSSLEPLSQTISALQSRGLKVVLIGQSPSFHIPVPKIYWWRTRKAQAFRPEFEAATEVAINVELKRIAGSALFIDPSLAFCRADKCLIGEADNPYFVDKGHFTEAGGQHAIRSFWEQLEQFVLKDQR
ncbi:MAG: SGNH hydrolase domain-containing protein, partial [Hyphomicrobiaceae bacterium]